MMAASRVGRGDRRSMHQDQAATPTNLPLRRTALIGREQDLAAVRELVLQAEGRLVTLTGAGGSGKTSLALAFIGHPRSPPPAPRRGVCPGARGAAISRAGRSRRAALPPGRAERGRG